MEKYNFKVGDKVRIRSWKDMKKEFGSAMGGIDTTYIFTSAMAPLCGKTAIITNIISSPLSTGQKEISLTFNNVSKDEDVDFYFSTDMIEPVFNKEEELSIKRYNNKVVAKYGKKVGVAKCAPEDTFDFMTGAEIALLRLAGQGKSNSQIVKELIDIIYNNFND